MNLVAYKTKAVEGWDLETAPRSREWMDETHERFAYRCLPLVMANQAGWIIRSPVSFSVRWSGSQNSASAMKFRFTEQPEVHAASITSHFGYGILSFVVPYLFRTDPGICLIVRGLPNAPKFNCTPLEGIVETDWSPFSFTMNWKIHLPLWPVKFQKGEPICFIQPYCLATLEQTTPVMKQVYDNPELQAQIEEWSNSRRAFNNDPNRSGWQKHYHKGIYYDGREAPEHRTNLRLKDFQGIGSA